MTEPAPMSDERRFVRRVLIVLGLTTLVILAWQLRTLLLMLFGAIVVATVFRAFADRIEKLVRCRQGIAIVVSIAIGLAIIIGLVALFGSHVVQQVALLRETLP